MDGAALGGAACERLEPGGLVSAQRTAVLEAPREGGGVVGTHVWIRCAARLGRRERGARFRPPPGGARLVRPAWATKVRVAVRRK